MHDILVVCIVNISRVYQDYFRILGEKKIDVLNQNKGLMSWAIDEYALIFVIISTGSTFEKKTL